MKAQYLDLRNNKRYEQLEQPAKILYEGGIIVFPTETVYGLGANGLKKEAVEKIYKAKGRKLDNPLILHISDMGMLEKIATQITTLEYCLMEAFWPGPFTIILQKKEIVPNIVTGGLETVGIRMPSGKIAQKLIHYAGVPVAAPSANISGRPSGTNLEDIQEELGEKVDYMIDGGDCEIGVESTVVRVLNHVPHILRPGKITPEQIKQVAGNVAIDQHVLNKLETEKPILSPGMKYRHYAPEAKCVLVYSQQEQKLVNKITEIAKQYKTPLILAKHKNITKYFPYLTIDIGDNLEEISKNIFRDLRKVDTFQPDIVIIEGTQKEGLGLAIMNRLIRACEYQYIEI